MFAVGFPNTRVQRKVIQNLVTGHLVVLGLGTDTVYSPSGHLVYQEGVDLWAVPFSIQDLQLQGKPFLVKEDAGSPSVADDGTLVYLDYIPPQAQLVWRDRRGQRSGNVGEPQAIAENSRIHISADGRRVAYEIGDFAGRDVWMYDLQRSTRRKVTSDPANDFSARCSAVTRLMDAMLHDRPLEH